MFSLSCSLSMPINQADSKRVEFNEINILIGEAPLSDSYLINFLILNTTLNVKYFSMCVHLKEFQYFAGL